MGFYYITIIMHNTDILSPVQVHLCEKFTETCPIEIEQLFIPLHTIDMVCTETYTG